MPTPSYSIVPPKSQSNEIISWAVADTRGNISGENIHRTHKSASLTKAMMAVVYARKHKDISSMRPVIKRMIISSDNNAANTLLGMIGSASLDGFATDIGMKDFRANGHWANADLSPYDQALFWSKLPSLIPANHRSELLGYFNNVVSYQQWGIAPIATKRGWTVYQKSGWRPEGNRYRFNQAVRMCKPKIGCWVMVFLSENISSSSVAHWRAEEFAEDNIPRKCGKKLAIGHHNLHVLITRKTTCSRYG